MPTEKRPHHLPMSRSLVSKLPDLGILPKGLHLRTWQDGDEVTVCDLLSNAFQDPEMAVFELDLEPFWRACPGIEPDGIFVIENDDGTALATATARIDPSQPGIGRLHRVAVRRNTHRQGLGRIVVVRALNHLAENGCKKVIVGGMTNGLQAVSLYLNLNFAPIIDTPAAYVLWSEIYEFIVQVTPSNSDIYQRLTLIPFSGELQPSTVGTDWVDDFITEDGKVWLTQATIDGIAKRVRLNSDFLSPSELVQMLVQNGIDKRLPIVLRLHQKGSTRTESKQILESLRTAGYRFSAAIGKTDYSECLSLCRPSES